MPRGGCLLEAGLSPGSATSWHACLPAPLLPTITSQRAGFPGGIPRYTEGLGPTALRSMLTLAPSL